MMNTNGGTTLELILHNLLRYDGNVTKLAIHLGINRNNLHKLMRKCSINSVTARSDNQS